MRFWDQVVFRVYATFVEGYPPGHRPAARILQLAYERQRFELPALNDLSVLLCLLVCPCDWSLYRAALAEYQRRGLSERDVGDALLKACPQQVGHLASVGSDDPLPGGLVLAAMVRHCVPSLQRFLARMYQVDLATAVLPAGRALGLALGQYGVAEMVETAGDFARFLCRYVLARIPRRVLQAALSKGWGAGLEREERGFLARCRQVQVAQRLLIYLCLYAELNAEQIAHVIQTVDPRYGVGNVGRILEETWITVV